jgi:hypothetical protein
MTNPWQWLVPGGIGAVIGSALTEVFRWFYPNHKDWKAERQAKTEKEIDRRVMRALEDRSLWKGSRPQTGGGDYAVRVEELASALSLSDEDVSDSLERLGNRERARYAGGGHWHSTRRL